MQKQRCQTCKIEKSLNEFSNNRKAENGRCKACKECEKIRSKARYKKEGEKMRAQMANLRKNNYEKRIEIERKSRAKNKEKNRPSRNARQSIRNRLVSDSKYVIIYKDLKRIYSEPCFNCGSLKNQSLDHRIPLSRGGEHKIGNMLTLCQPCNASKHSRTIMEWKLSKIKKGDD